MFLFIPLFVLFFFTIIPSKLIMLSKHIRQETNKKVIMRVFDATEPELNTQNLNK